jgi:hypothetical protein
VTDDGHPNDARPTSFSLELYQVGFIVSATPAFCLTWLYCVAAYGLAGAVVGWLPALVVAGASGAAWPGLVVATVAVLAHV